MLSKKREPKKEDRGHASTYSMRYSDETVPKLEMPEKGMPAPAAYQLVHDELNLDGNPSLNLASFVTTWMEPEADKLIMENINKNFIDHDEYPQTEVIHERCVNMLARLFNSPKDAKTIGTATIGSSEAIMLALLAHKWTWINRRKKEKKPYDKPNMVFGADVHVCWEKFCKYFDVEMRLIPMEEDRFTIGPDEVEPLIDENTCCVGAILGTTFTGQYDAIKEMNELLLKIKKEKKWNIPMHVDGASGGMIAPFVYPDVEWDFRLEQVKTINISGHKYGLVYPGLGWLVFRDEADVPDDIVFTVNYLGGEMPTFTLNFSRGSAMIIAQYYNFLRLGFEGHKKIMTNCVDNAKYLSEKLVKSGLFDMLNPTQMLPIVAVKLKDKKYYSVYDISNKLREKGYIIPAYTLPPNAEKIEIMRMVIKENFSRDMCEMLYNDIMETCEFLKKAGNKPTLPPDTDKPVKKVC